MCQELEARVSNPIDKRGVWVETEPDKHTLNRLTEAGISNIEQTLTRIDPHQFDMAVELLANTKRSLYSAGGRITRALANYLFLHMQVVRSRATQVQAIASNHPQVAGNALSVIGTRRSRTRQPSA